MDELTTEDRHRIAAQASTLAQISVLFLAVSSCGMFFGPLLALPLSYYALYQARVALDTVDPDAVTRAYAAPARNMGLVVAIVTTLWCSVVALYLLTYLGMIAFVVVLAVLNP